MFLLLLVAVATVPEPVLLAAVGLGAVTGGLAWTWTWLTTTASTVWIWRVALLSTGVAIAAYVGLAGLVVVLGAAAVDVLAIGTAIGTVIAARRWRAHEKLSVRRRR